MTLPTSKLDVASTLASFVISKGGSINGPQLGALYNAHPECKDAIKSARAPGTANGVRAFITLHKDKLAFRIVEGHPVIYAGPASSLPDSDRIGRAAAKVAVGDYDSMLAAIEAELEALKLKVGSMRKMGEEVKSRGICLTNAAEYGPSLRQKLRGNRGLCVNKENAKEYPHAKKCLVVLR